MSRQNPPLPRAFRGYYRDAKAAEQQEQFATAEQLYRKSLSIPSERHSAVKDLAGLMHMMGRTSEAISFLESHPPTASSFLPAHRNLLDQLRTAAANLERNRDLPRTLLIEAATLMDWSSLSGLVNNSLAVRELDYFQGQPGNRAILVFASNSAARRALRGLQRPDLPVDLRAAWAPAAAQFAMSPHEVFRSEADWIDCFENPVADPPRFIPPENFDAFPQFDEVGRPLD